MQLYAYSGENRVVCASHCMPCVAQTRLEDLGYEPPPFPKDLDALVQDMAGASADDDMTTWGPGQHRMLDREEEVSGTASVDDAAGALHESDTLEQVPPCSSCRSVPSTSGMTVNVCTMFLCHRVKHRSAQAVPAGRAAPDTVITAQGPRTSRFEAQVLRLIVQRELLVSKAQKGMPLCIGEGGDAEAARRARPRAPIPGGSRSC